MRKLFLFFIVLSVHISVATATHLDYKFRTMSPKGGLFYDGISAVEQDRIGFIWILVGNDLLRFDGYEYKKYGDKLAANVYDSRWNINDISTTYNGELIVATDKGVFKYASDIDSFELLANVEKINLLRKGSNENDLWMVSDNTLFRYDMADKRLDPVFYNGHKVQNISKIINTAEETLFATYYNQIYVKNNLDKTDSLKLFIRLEDRSMITDMAVKEGDLWVLLRGGSLQQFNIKEQRLNQAINLSSKGYEKCLLIDKNQNIWIGTQQGLIILNLEKNLSKFCVHSDLDEFSLPNSSIWNILEDENQNIWIGTYSGGLCYINLDESEWFNTYNARNSAMLGNTISSFAENERYLWIGTEGAGINRINKETNEIAYFNHVSNKNSLPHNNVKSLALLPNGDLWIAMFKGGLSKYSSADNKFTNYTKNNDSKYKLLSNDLRKIIYDGDGGLWIAYQLNKVVISYISLKNRTIKHYNYTDGTAVGNKFIYDVSMGNDGRVYFVTREGIYTTSKEEDAIRKIESSYNNTHLKAQACWIDKSDTIWLGTVYNGLLKAALNHDHIEFEQVVAAQNFTTIVSLCKDEKDMVWFGTDNGLYQYTGKLYSYDVNEGFQGQVYYPLSAYKSMYSNYIYFGGTNGYTKFLPDAISLNTVIPRPIISNIVVDNNSFTLQDVEDKEVVLDYKMKNFGFKLASNNYLVPAKNKFKYRLKGYDNRWLDADATSRLVQFTKVPAGRYQLEVLTANNDGLWNETPLTLSIRKKSSPWLSGPAYFLYSVLILGVILSIIYYYYERRKLEVQLYLDRIERDKDRQLYNSQMQFFTNISHDFRTPLSLILGVLDNIKQEGVKEYYYDILRNNGNRLLGLVNELMDFRKVESGSITLVPSANNINKLVEEITSDFKESFLNKGLDFTVQLDPELDNALLSFDKNVVEKIILNLLNNALKYTNVGAVKITTLGTNIPFKSNHKHSYSIGELDTDYFSIVIEDTGVGVSEKSIESVFKRYYQVNATADKHLGTGVGLALVKSLVVLQKSVITIFSERDCGTDFVVQIPKVVVSEAEGVSVGKIDGNNEENNGVIYDAEITEKIKASDLLFNEKKRILIVEDNTDLRTLLMDYLSPYYDVFGLEDGDEVAEFIEHKTIDLIISDIMMPIKDGVTLCKELKSKIETSHIPFILLTAKTEIDSKIEGVGSGADLYLEKPVDFALLLISVSNIFKQQEKLREHYAKNFFVEDIDLSVNKQENEFLKKIIEIVDNNLTNTGLDVNFISAEIGMSRSKLYSKLKTLTGKSIVEFILEYKLRKAAKTLIEENVSITEVMNSIGMKSQSYFTTVFKKEFGETPAAFVTKYKKGDM